MGNRHLFLASLASVSLFSLSTAAIAADAVVPQGADSATELQEIVVTGEKRETSLQRAALSITAVDTTALQQRNANEINDLNGLVPGLSISKSEGSARIVAIRGIGYETSANPNSQPGVAFHINGVYIAHVMALAQDMIDVERVEVLRGPQGTVFGQTSTGGAINVITKKPILGETSGEAAFSYGNYDYAKVNAGLNIPLGDTLAARVAAQYLRHDGYGKAIGVPNVSEYELDDANNLGLRGSLLWEPTDRFTAILSAQTFDTDRNGALQKNVLDTTPDARTVAQDFPSTFALTTRMTDLQLSYDLGDFATFKSVSAYQFMLKEQTADTDRLATTPYVHTVRWRDKSKAFTQELSLTGTPGGMVDWTVGGFFLRQRALKDYLSLGSNPALTYQGMPIVFATYSPYQHTSIAGYGQAIVHATDALSITAGARYSWDKTTGQPINFFNQFGPANPREVTSAAVTGKIGVDYQITPVNMVYLTASRGYKPSGVNFNQGQVQVPQSYKKEIVNALEVGTKNDFFDRTLRLNASAYYYWYDNYQFTAEDPRPNSGGSWNIPRAEIYGAEFEASLLPVKGLRIDGTLTLAKGSFKGDFYTIDSQGALVIRRAASVALGLPQPYVSGYGYNPNVIAAVSANLLNTNGRDVAKLPGVQGSIAVTYEADIGAGNFSIRGDMVHRGTFNSRIFDGGALDRVPAYTLFNANLQYQPHDSNFTFSLSAQNLFDNDGVNSLFTDPYGALTTSVEYVNPRQVFGTVSYRF
ncbi:MAG: TonB-dependent receptor [Alphaproteobacteria bacterium]|nr:TonB-dependent receptor [Alphaproteobacteria bacterium]MBU0795436.1 TonB-dependent receptor [Alphaproteobacteria bacterium]MBU0876609.1 TonB-dependent receptor [Alphaproteobacteria bacterium]MBU1769310.1 TonB-dependent receptor [Alphaproteobacteria bacterium]